MSIRLKHFMSVSGLSPSVFADTCGIPRPTLSQLLNGRNKKISDVVIGLIHRAYPSLSVLWLLFGEGEMIEKSTSQYEEDIMDDDPDVFSFDFNNENPEFTADYTVGSEFSKENALNRPQDRGYSPYKSERYASNSPKISNEFSSSNSQKPRSVVRITVFYDDNSYETFEPVKKD